MSRQRLIEKFVVSPEDYNQVEDVSLTESQRTISIEEAGKKKQYKAEAVYTFPISRPGEKNLNERIYPVKLWENVIKNKQGENSFGLMDHPTNEGSTKDAWCVWRNLRFSEDKKLILADAYKFGSWGRQVKEALEAGGKIGLSTSGFGEFEKDEMTVRADTFELERVADHVLTPSYSVFGTQEDAVETDSSTVKESYQGETVSETSSTIKEEPETNGDVTMKENKLSTFEEKSFRLNVQSRMTEISKESKASVREVQYVELLSYFEEGVAEDLRGKIHQEIEAARQEIQELAEKGASMDHVVESTKKELTEQVDAIYQEKKELEESLSDLREKFEKATELLDSLKVYSNKMKEMYEVALAEKNTMVTATEYKEAVIFAEALEAEKEELMKEVATLKAKLRKLEKMILEAKKKKAKKSEEEDEESDSEDEMDDDDDEEDDEEDEVEESYAGVKPEVAQYYEDLVYSQPEVKKIRKEILSSKTLIEAQRTYLRLKGLIYSMSRDERPEIKDTNLFKKTEGRRIVDKEPKLSIREGWV